MKTTVTRYSSNNTAIVLIATIGAVLVGGTVTLGSDNVVFAGKENGGINVRSDTNKKQECETAGGVSPVTASCSATSMNTVAQNGGGLSELKSGNVGGIIPLLGGQGKVNGKENGGINVRSDTNKKQECETAGGVSRVTAVCPAVSASNESNTGGVLHKYQRG